MDEPVPVLAANGNPLDSYESLEVIGTGSFGTIHKVRRKSDGQELKFEHTTERDRKQIIAEAYVAGKGAGVDADADPPRTTRNILKDLNHE